MTSLPFSSGPVIRVAFALVLTTGLLLFLVAMRTMERHLEVPTMTFRAMETTDPVSLPEPPPPSAEVTPPTPPVAPELPTLDLEIDTAAPPVQANLSPELKLDLTLNEFATDSEPTRERMTFAGSDLDTKPRLVYLHTVPIPASLKNKSVKSMRVTLRVAIGPSGKVRVLGVVESPDREFTEVATLIATRSKFTAPIRDGRTVNTIFNWPLELTF